MNLFTVTIPFYSKNWIKNESNINKMKGNIIYKFDLNTYKMTGYLQLSNCTCRVTDALNKSKIFVGKIKKFRNKFSTIFNPPNFNLSKNPLFHTFNQEELKSINSYLKNDITSSLKTQYTYFIGYTSSGGGSNQKNSSIRCGDAIYFNYQFLNVFDRFEKLKGFKLNNFPKQVNYSLEEIISENIVTGLKETFEKINEFYYSKKKIKKNYFELQDIEFIKKIKLDLKTNPNIETTNNYVNNQFRTYYISKVKSFVRKGQINDQILINQNPSEQIERAHIIAFGELIDEGSEKSLLKAIDPYNCLHIDANSHRSFDAKKFYFNSNGDKVYKDNHQEKFIDKSKLTNQQLQYMEDYEKDFKLHLK